MATAASKQLKSMSQPRHRAGSKEILVHEGDFVKAGQVLARMDTAVLEAQLREAEAQLRKAVIGIETAKSLVDQREAEKTAARCRSGSARR